MFRYLQARGLFRQYMSWWTVIPIISTIGLYKLGAIDANRAMQRAAHLVRGIHVADLWEIVQTWFEESVVPAIAVDGRGRLEWHRAQGHVPVICSAASQFSVQPVAHYLGVEHTVYTDWLVHNGKLSGTVREPVVYGSGKVYWMERWAQEHQIELAESYFYSDHISDRPLLERVAHPTVINPNRKLAQLASNLGWQVQRWT